VLTHGLVINGTNRPATDFTLAELQTMTLGTWQGEPVKIPTLEQALRLNGSRGPLFIDLHVDVPTNYVKDAVLAAGFDESLLGITADFNSAFVFKRAFPRARVVWKNYAYPSEISRAAIDLAASSGIDGMMLQEPLDGQAIANFVDYIHWKGMRLILFVHYAQNTLAQLQQMVDDRVDFILTVHHEMRSQLNWPGDDPNPAVLNCTYDSLQSLVRLYWRPQRPFPYHIQSSTDLVHWTELPLNIDCTEAPSLLKVQTSAGSAQRFYRLDFVP
jgi:hypothetical protein